MKMISAEAVKSLLTWPEEYAFLDVREHGQYGEGHPFFVTSVPYSVLENRMPTLVPRKATRCIVMDDGDGVARRAGQRLAAMGYSAIDILDGGAPAWAAAGFNLFKGVNVPSKTFGELVEHHYDTPSISAEELKRRMDGNEPLLLLDGRTPEEFTRQALPGAASCPNGELPYRLPQLLADASTPVVVNCAGRTRSIIGAETLRRSGLPNPVFSLCNGTQGWRLAGFELARENATVPPPKLDPDQRSRAQAEAERLIAGYRINRVSPDCAAQWLEQQDRTTYLFDVRSAEEYLSAHWPGARHVPGGQLVQATDRYIGVRNARVIVSDDVGLRAANAAIWLAGMGHEVYLLDADASEGAETGHVPEPEFDIPNGITLDQIAGLVGDEAVLLDASRGMAYREAHITGAKWVTRARLDGEALADASVLVVGQEPALVKGVVDDLQTQGVTRVWHSVSGPRDWEVAGLPVEATPDCPTESDCIDYLFFVHDRHDGNLDASRRYLEWELGLVEQADEQELSVLRPLQPELSEAV